MRITESKLRELVRSVIKEGNPHSDYRLSVEFGMKIEEMVDEFKESFVNNCRMLRIFSEDDLNDYVIEDFLRKYLKEVVYLLGEHVARQRFSGNYYAVTQSFKSYLENK